MDIDFIKTIISFSGGSFSLWQSNLQEVISTFCVCVSLVYLNGGSMHAGQILYTLHHPCIPAEDFCSSEYQVMKMSAAWLSHILLAITGMSSLSTCIFILF